MEIKHTILGFDAPFCSLLAPGALQRISYFFDDMLQRYKVRCHNYFVI